MSMQSPDQANQLNKRPRLKTFTHAELMAKEFPPVSYEEAWEGSEIMNQPGMKEKHMNDKKPNGQPIYLES